MYHKRLRNQKIYKDDNPSRFLLDLNQLNREHKELAKPIHKKATKSLFQKLNILDRIRENKIKKECNQSNIAYTPGVKLVPSELVKEYNSYKNTFFSSRFEKEEQSELNHLEKIYKTYEHKLIRLAFFPIIKSFAHVAIGITMFFYKIIHKTTWSIIFLIKFIKLFTLSIFSPVKASELSEDYFKTIAIKFVDKKLKKQREININDAREIAKLEENYFAEEEFIPDLKEYEELDKKEKEQEEEFFIFDIVNKKKPSKKRKKKTRKNPIFTKLKPAIPFIVVLIIIIMPFKTYSFVQEMRNLKGKILGVSKAAISEMKHGSKKALGKDFNQANKNFESASKNFLVAKKEISEISGLLSVLGAIIPNKNIKLASHAEKVLESGALSAEIANNLATIFNCIDDEKEISIKNIVNSFHENGQEIQILSHKLRNNIDSIDPSTLPNEYKEKFTILQDKVRIIDDSMGEFVDILEKMKIFLGMEYDKRYLLVFQNNTELRASGGFVGSYAIIDFRNGEIKNLEVPGGGSYDTEAGLYDLVAAPDPLHLVNPLWHFWDSNWWPDWERSAKKLMWFLEKSNGPSVDGVLSFTPNVIEGLLTIIGEVDMTENYGVVINSENFWKTVQTFSEQKQDVTLKPKKIIGDLMTKIIAELPEKINKESFLKMISVTEKNLNEKHILFYFTNTELQNKVCEYDWGGKIKETSHDYLMVINTNIAGGKSDKLVKEKIEHYSELSSDGSITNTVKITRTHTGIKRALFTGVRNVNWIRIYVPQGSKLISASGFETPPEKYFEYPDPSWSKDKYLEETEGEATIDINTGTKIYNESGKTVFANWTQVDPGKSITITIKYELPFSLKKFKKTDIASQIKNYLNPGKKDLIPYTLTVQKQPGSQGSNFTSNLKIAPNYKVVWKYPEDLSVLMNKWNIKETLNKDTYSAILLEQL